MRKSCHWFSFQQARAQFTRDSGFLSKYVALPFDLSSAGSVNIQEPVNIFHHILSLYTDTYAHAHARADARTRTRAHTNTDTDTHCVRLCLIYMIYMNFQRFEGYWCFHEWFCRKVIRWCWCSYNTRSIGKYFIARLTGDKIITILIFFFCSILLFLHGTRHTQHKSYRVWNMEI